MQQAPRSVVVVRHRLQAIQGRRDEKQQRLPTPPAERPARAGCRGPNTTGHLCTPYVRSVCLHAERQACGPSEETRDARPMAATTRRGQPALSGPLRAACHDAMLVVDVTRGMADKKGGGRYLGGWGSLPSWPRLLPA